MFTPTLFKKLEITVQHSAGTERELRYGIPFYVFVVIGVIVALVKIL